ncbi:alpha/beta hydrolase [Spirillospora sp. NPDC029432]|uniref:alpha/beta hydrolase n=1 Tax=Spirillospora sp. NPDC029432 TaxID=3154599 RepID=UPI003454C2D0
MRATSVISVTMALTLAAMGCSDAAERPEAAPKTPPAGSPTGTDAFYKQRLSWSDCGGGFQCAKAEVPLDYTKPAGGKMRIALIRMPAKNKSQRIGSLFTNPGGPGGSGVDFIRQAAPSFGKDLRERFDIVGFDPRGVGASDPVKCMDGPRLDKYLSTDSSPDDQQEVEALAAESRNFAQACQSNSSGSLPYVGTLNAARDMDILRAAVGDAKMTYYGASYGTYLGAFYAEQFPKNVRALVLDGAVDPKVSSTQTLVEQAKGFETAFRAFAADCVKRADCPLGKSEDEAVKYISDFLAKLDKTPLPQRRDSRKVTESWAAMGIATALYAKETWTLLRQAIVQAAQQNDGTLLMVLADQMVERKEDGSYSNQTAANMAVNCVDKPNPADLAGYQKYVDTAKKTSPQFGPFVVWGGLPCVYWPVQTKEQPKATTAKGAAPILVIGTTRDPATPYKWSQSLASQLDSGVLLTLEGDGHTAYLQANPCISQATDRYLVTAKPPANGTVCR